MKRAQAIPKRVETGLASCLCCHQTVAISDAGSLCEPKTGGLYPYEILGRITVVDGVEVWRCNIEWNDETSTWDLPHRCPGNPPLGRCRCCGKAYYSVAAREQYFVDESFCWGCESRRWD